MLRSRIQRLSDRLRVRAYGDPALRAPGDVVKTFDEDLEILCWAMLSVMDKSDGVGLAAQQVGRKERVCVIDTSCRWSEQTFVEWDGMDLLHLSKESSFFPLFVINGKVINQSDELLEFSEGCLSSPGIYARTRRHQWVAVSYQDPQGGSHQIRADGLLGQCLQHEIDHNNGIFFTDPERLVPADYEKIHLKLEELSRRRANA
ncbi:MAG: peptide deformylase [Puniceicoccales bacterium]|nr:peptide deformylase [Puniceicoccales bacterium]